MQHCLGIICNDAILGGPNLPVTQSGSLRLQALLLEALSVELRTTGTFGNSACILCKYIKIHRSRAARKHMHKVMVAAALPDSITLASDRETHWYGINLVPPVLCRNTGQPSSLCCTMPANRYLNRWFLDGRLLCPCSMNLA